MGRGGLVVDWVELWVMWEMVVLEWFSGVNWVKKFGCCGLLLGWKFFLKLLKEQLNLSIKVKVKIILIRNCLNIYPCLI